MHSTIPPVDPASGTAGAHELPFVYSRRTWEMHLSSTIERIHSPALRAASVRVSRLLGASPERVFDAWLNADDARTFLFAREPGDAVRADTDARVGGRFRIVRRQDGQDIEYSGEYLEIDRPHLLVFSLFIEKYAQRDDRVIVELAPVGEQSLLVLTHELSLANPAERSRVQREWSRVLESLGALCTRAGQAWRPEMLSRPVPARSS